ncbi:5'/3'-nucleotidase SurE [Cellulosimicrobium sp. CpK407]|uniref:5'/3'-nucleotidase SurE n=1 Tax=unclassified Cellulosimicrobium TaxID=2624466 RepID=UPI003F3C2911
MTARTLRRALLAGSAALAAAFVAALGPASASTVPDDPLEGLRIVISNDDSMQNSRPNGSDGEGLYELRKVFCDAGADVVVVAPWGYQSGAGTAVTNSGTFHMQEADTLPERYAADCGDAPSQGAVFGVCQPIDGRCTPESRSATPVDTVKLAVRGGLQHVLGWTERPDLVLSGINSGPNLGSSVNDSGTAGAALSALSVNTPGFAISASATGADHQAVYERTARFAVRYVEEVVRQDALTTEYVTNINFPRLTADQSPAGVVVAPVGTGTTARHSYNPSGERSFTVGLSGCQAGDTTCVAETRPDADYLMNRAGYITVTPLTPDRTHLAATPEIGSVISELSTVAVRASATGRCIAGTAYVAALVRNDDTVPLDVTLSTPFGERSVSDVQPGAAAYQSFSSRSRSVEAGTSRLTASGDGRSVEVDVDYAAVAC